MALRNLGFEFWDLGLRFWFRTWSWGFHGVTAWIYPALFGNGGFRLTTYWLESWAIVTKAGTIVTATPGPRIHKNVTCHSTSSKHKGGISAQRTVRKCMVLYSTLLRRISPHTKAVPLANGTSNASGFRVLKLAPDSSLTVVLPFQCRTLNIFSTATPGPLKPEP